MQGRRSGFSSAHAPDPSFKEAPRTGRQAAVSTDLYAPESAFLLCRLDEHLRCARLILERHWRTMGALEARYGMRLFGVGAAYIFAVRQAYWALMIRPHWVKI
jgi:hypothetical protein